jgi:hypothetical protein
MIGGANARWFLLLRTGIGARAGYDDRYRGITA